MASRETRRQVAARATLGRAAAGPSMDAPGYWGRTERRAVGTNSRLSGQVAVPSAPARRSPPRARAQARGLPVLRGVGSARLEVPAARSASPESASETTGSLPVLLRPRAVLESSSESDGPRPLLAVSGSDEEVTAEEEESGDEPVRCLQTQSRVLANAPDTRAPVAP